ncbi:MAG: CpsD/CapB family tyrosine-protein kinase, partial [Planctomycetaceae bacterium]|nr:CpsD/CapB family tyrosine-protein kinase [Planctomycetaceae bacterium]
MAEAERLRSVRDRKMQLYESVVGQFGEMKLNMNMGEGVVARMLLDARFGAQVFPLPSQFLGLGAFLGILAGLGLGYLVEMADRSFRKPEDIIREFGVPIVGHIPFMQEKRLKEVPANARLDKTAVCHHLPRSRSAEAYRAVRTAICFSAISGSHRVIQVTSPAAGDGKSTLALNLAISMAMSGKRTILIESDFRRPKVHKLAGVENDRGIVDVLRGDCELADATQTSEVTDLDILPCGNRPKNPSELLTRPEYEQLLQVLRQKYDYVIVDSPPILAVTD